MEGLDAEDQAIVLRAFQQACAEAVRRSDGTIVQCNEHGLLVCFGYPVAYEDAAHRAVRTGLGILEDMKVLGEQLRRMRAYDVNAEDLVVFLLGDDLDETVGFAEDAGLARG